MHDDDDNGMSDDDYDDVPILMVACYKREIGGMPPAVNNCIMFDELKKIKWKYKYK